MAVQIAISAKQGIDRTLRAKTICRGTGPATSARLPIDCTGHAATTPLPYGQFSNDHKRLGSISAQAVKTGRARLAGSVGAPAVNP